MSNLFSTDRRVINLNSKDMFSIETFAQMTNLSKCKYDEKQQIIFDFPLIDMDTISRNRSMYAAEGYFDSIFGSMYIMEKLKRGCLYGELGHPDPTCSRERFMKVEDDNVSHRNINIKRDGKRLYGDVQAMKPKGDIMWDRFIKGVNIAMSTRVLTPNYEERADSNGDKYIYKYGQMRFVSFDCVDVPGFKQASVVEDVDSYDASKLPVEAISQNSKENWEGIHINWTQGRKKDEFMRLLKSQESLPILEDIYGFDMKNVNNISYSKEGLITLTLDNNKEYSRSIKIPTNVYKVNQVLGLE